MRSFKLEMQKEIGQSPEPGDCSDCTAFVHLVPAEGLQGSRRQIGTVLLILSSQVGKMFGDLSAQTEVSQLELHQQETKLTPSEDATCPLRKSFQF